MVPPPPAPDSRPCGDRPLRVSGDADAVAGAVVRLTSRGWGLDLEPVAEGGGVWALWRSCDSCRRC